MVSSGTNGYLGGAHTECMYLEGRGQRCVMTQEKGQGQVMVALGATMGSSEDSNPHTGKGRGAIKGGRKVVIWSDFLSFFLVVFFLWPHL